MRIKRKFVTHQNLLAEINITPLVDVMLVLLIVFMVTSPMLISGVDINLPKTSTNPISGQDEPLTISVDKHGKIFLVDTEIKLEKLVAKLELIVQQKSDTQIFIRGDNDVDYGNVMQVISEITKAGFHKIVLVTQIADKPTITHKK